MRAIISTADPRPIYVQIMDEVKRALVLGTLRPDEALPSVRQLAIDLRVNPNTVAQAYRELEREGVVYVRRGQGTFASSDATSGGTQELLERAREVAARALVDATRNGVTPAALVEAIEEAALEAAASLTGDET